MVAQNKENNEGKVFFFIYMGGLIVFVLAMLGFGMMKDDPNNGELYHDLSGVFRVIGLTHGLFTGLTYLTVRAVRGGYFEPINLLAWLLFGALWFYAI